MKQFVFHPSATHPLTSQPREWKILEPGISQMTLNHDPVTGRATYLQSWGPKTSNQIQIFVHDYIEEIMIIQGDLRDLKGRQSGTGCIVEGEGEAGDVWGKGSYAYRKSGIEHEPFRSEGGCLMFIVVIPVDKKEELI